MIRKRRVLFFAEAVTLAHVARPMVLAKSLEYAGHEPVMACHDRYKRFLLNQTWQVLPLGSISSEQFLHQLALGKPVYSAETLRSYVKEDIKLIDRVKPDLIVGDFRLSLSVSARIVGIPYAAITNAYWSPFCRHKSYPLPVLPLTRYFPLPVAQFIFDVFKRKAFALHCKPLNQVRKEYGLTPKEPDLRWLYTDADFSLYADCPKMFPMESMPDRHHFLGPVLWSPPVTDPVWWNQLPASRPIVYLTLGSSGSPNVMQLVVDALASLPVTVMASTAGAPLPGIAPPNLFTADYLPGCEAAARSNLVICNGGSPTSQQALACGVPVLGIPSNMDQFMNMAAVICSGAGEIIRADRVRKHSVQDAVTRLISEPERRHQAKQLAKSFSDFDCGELFCHFVDKVC